MSSAASTDDEEAPRDDERWGSGPVAAAAGSVRVPAFGLSTDEIKDELDKLRNDFSIAIVRAKNPFNVGAIIRVAHSFLVKEIFLIGTAPYYERAAMGMHKYETIVECATEDDFLK